MADKQSMIFYYEWMEDFVDMTDEEVGKLVNAILKYDMTGEDTKFEDRSLRSVFRHMKKSCDINREKYNERSQINSKNGKKGGRPKKQTVFEKTERFSEKAKKADTVTVTVTDSVTDTVTGNVYRVTDAPDGACDGDGDTHTRQEVRTFFADNQFTSDPDKFIDYNIGRGNAEIFDKPKRWQAVARNWEKNEASMHPPDSSAINWEVI